MNVTALLELSRSRGYECYDGTRESGSHWINLLDRPILGVDFHHTISTRCGACEPMDLGVLGAGPPQKGASAAMKILAEFFEVIIFTGYGASFSKSCHSELEEYLNKHNIPFDSINTTKPSFMFQVDDRGVRHWSWQDTLREIGIRSVKPEGVLV